MPKEAALKEVADCHLRRPLASNKLFNCADAHVGDSAPPLKAPNRESAPRRRGPAKILDIDDAGATVKFQSQTFKVSRYCVRKNEGGHYGRPAFVGVG